MNTLLDTFTNGNGRLSDYLNEFSRQFMIEKDLFKYINFEYLNQNDDCSYILFSRLSSNEFVKNVT